MGSREVKMRLAKQQRDVLVGTVLGDGCLETNGLNVRLRIDHSEKQKAYVEWKYEIFANIAASKPRLINVLDKRTNKVYQHRRFDTLSLKLFTGYKRSFYCDNRKVIPRSIGRLLKSKLSLAVWFMDDGYRRNDCKGLHINTQAYRLEEQKILQNCLKKNFNVSVSIHKQSGKYKLYIPSSESKKFCNLIAKFVVPSMNYKVL